MLLERSARLIPGLYALTACYVRSINNIDIKFCDIITAVMDATQARDRLLQEQKSRGALAERLRGHEADPVEAGEVSTVERHAGERGNEAVDRARDLTALRILETELDDIQQGLRRIEDGTYGRCEECGKPIGDERLQAKPWARLCFDHQLSAEAQQAGARR